MIVVVLLLASILCIKVSSVYVAVISAATHDITLMLGYETVQCPHFGPDRLLSRIMPALVV